MKLTQPLLKKLKSQAKSARLDILNMIYEAGSGHLGSSYSTLEMLLALYSGGILKFNPKKPNWQDRDYFLLSNGHACPAFYTVLAYNSFFKKQKLKNLRKFSSGLEGHPKKGSLPGIEISSGSLGMGLSQGLGIALGLERDNKKNKVVVMMSDGEQDEGSVWEAVMAAAHFKVDNLIAIIDKNGNQIGGYTKTEMNLDPLAGKYLSFNWHVVKINGHDFKSIFKGFAKLKSLIGPKVIISHTLGCKGLSFMEGRPDVHHPKVDSSFYKKALKELDKP
jgi:transketolase